MVEYDDCIGEAREYVIFEGCRPGGYLGEEGVSFRRRKRKEIAFFNGNIGTVADKNLIECRVEKA